MSISHVIFAVSSTITFLTATSALAESLPPEGPVSATFTATVLAPAKPMPVGGGREFDVLNQAMAVSNQAGNAVLNNMGGRCQFSRLRDPAAKTLELRGFCTYVDKDGDQTFEQCDFLPGHPNTCKLIGGTGKFDGLQAELIITVDSLKSNFDGIGQVIGHKQGSYKLVKSN